MRVLINFFLLTFIPVAWADLDLSSINGVNGFKVEGISNGYKTGMSVSHAGDFNGDGLDDLLIGSYGKDEVHVIFGTTIPNSGVLELSDLDGQNGFTIKDNPGYTAFGFSISSAGDLNADGYDDIVIGANNDESHDRDSGAVYVVFGGAQSNPLLQISDLDGTNGFELLSETKDGFFGTSVSNAGDINEDGVDDLITCAPGADSCYVVYGSSNANAFPASFNVSSLDGSNGFRIYNSRFFESGGMGGVVASAGDVNNDGLDDVLIGAPGGDGGALNTGVTFVVFGNENGFGDQFNLATLDGTNGLKLFGVAAYDISGFSLNGLGDINGDDIDDFVIGAPSADVNGEHSGSAYVIFGNSQYSSGEFYLSGLDGTNGFSIHGAATRNDFGRSVSGVGDVNGDRINDILINADGTTTTYLIYGKQTYDATMHVAQLGTSDVMKIEGAEQGYSGGESVSGINDFNGDGFNDYIIGASAMNTNGTNSGGAYIIHGHDVIFEDGSF